MMLAKAGGTGLYSQLTEAEMGRLRFQGLPAWAAELVQGQLGSLLKFCLKGKSKKATDCGSAVKS